MAQLFQFIWKTRYLLIWMIILLASMSLPIQSTEVLRTYWFDHRLNPEHAFWLHPFWQSAFWQQLSWRVSWQHLSWQTFWLAIGLVYSGFVFAAAAVRIATHKETEPLRAPRWVVTVALAAPARDRPDCHDCRLDRMVGGRTDSVPQSLTVAPYLVVALLLLALLIVVARAPRKRVVAFSNRLGAVFSSPIGQLSLDIATGVFVLGFLVVPLLPINYFIGLANTIGSLPTLLISLAVLMHVIHRLVTLEGNKRWTRVALAISGVILVALLVTPLVHRSLSRLHRRRLSSRGSMGVASGTTELQSSD